MKTSNFIIVILAVALVAAVVRIATAGKSESTVADASTGATTAHSNYTYTNILTRTSVRSYSDRSISERQIDSLLRAAMAAPTAVNKQPWRFVVITDRNTLDSIASNCKNIRMAAEAPLAIAVCGDMSKALEGDARQYWVQDCSAATENLLLAAHSMGLGAVWCGIYPIKERVEFISSLLSLPADIIPLNIIPIGYPVAPSTPKQKYDPSRIKRI